MTYLPDVNIWIALAAERHSHHGAAERWFKNLRDQKLVFCRTTQLGFLRLLTNRHVMEEEVMNPDQAWQAYRALRSDRRIGYLAEPSVLAETWDAFTKGELTSPNLWTDAYLCAFAHAAQATLVTFDKKIPAWDGVNCLVLGGVSEGSEGSFRG
jgi:toxin-antitoxin system PIN domain toxin